MFTGFRCTAQTLENPQLKRKYNKELFSHIAYAYSSITGFLSWGRDHKWKQQLILKLPPIEKPFILDLACGTGDITKLLADKYPRGKITGIDLTHAMISPAARALKKSNTSLQLADMCQIAFKDETFDIVTGGYALRNAPELKTALQEVHRVLKPKGTAAFLDFSKSPSLLRSFSSLKILSLWCCFWGLVFHLNPHTYGYIAKSLCHYPNRNQITQLFDKCGLTITSRELRFLGFAELITARKFTT
ncbi:MAG: class I SAM-dependent methyltransferase [Chitinispirillaceae bacterium]